jgi:transposase
MGEDTITMSAHEQRRAWVLTRVCEGAITLEEAAELLAISPRHARRLKAAMIREGPAALVHGNRGRPSPHRTDPVLAERVVALSRTRYGGTNLQHFTELLAEHEQVDLGVATVRRLLKGAGLASPRTRRVPAHRRRRERAPQEGLLLQIDGSRHPWLEDRWRTAAPSSRSLVRSTTPLA